MQCFIALGSNLGDRRRNLQAGLEGLQRCDLAPAAVSSGWETEPVGTSFPQWFWNMVVMTASRREPLDLLDALQRIEAESGRRRGVPNAPRTLDLDLLLVGDLLVEDARLRLPHPRMWQRSFVLEPLAEIAPDLCNPLTGRTVREECLRVRERYDVRRLGDLATCRSILL